MNNEELNTKLYEKMFAEQIIQGLAAGTGASDVLDHATRLCARIF